MVGSKPVEHHNRIVRTICRWTTPGTGRMFWTTRVWDDRRVIEYRTAEVGSSPVRRGGRRGTRSRSGRTTTPRTWASAGWSRTTTSGCRRGRGTTTTRTPTSRSSPGCSAGRCGTPRRVGSGVIGPGQVQRLSAGSGVVHSEVADGPEETRFLQAWVRPDEPGLEPGYLGAGVTLGEGWTRWRTVTARASYPSPRRVRRSTWPTWAADIGSTCPTRPRCTSSSPGARSCSASGSSSPGTRPGCVDEPGRPVTAEADSQLVVWASTARRQDPELVERVADQVAQVLAAAAR